MNPALWWVSIVLSSVILGWLAGWAQDRYQERQWRREMCDADDDL